MRRTPDRRWLAASLAAVALAVAARADNWPRWRGPNGDGISKETNIPAEWGESKNIAWKLPLPGMAGSTPVVWGDRIFLTSEDGDDLVLLCVSTDGKKLWQQKLGTGNRKVGPRNSGEGNLASASPSTDGKHVYTFVASGDLGCYDFDGHEVWHFNAQDRFGRFKIQFGLHSTPVLDGDRLYLQLIHSNGAWVIALDKATGETVWKVARPSDGYSENEHSYASPSLWRKGGEAYLIVHGNDYATAHSLQDGHEIWRLGGLNPKENYHPTRRYVASPVATPDLIVVPTAKDGQVVAVKPDAHGLIEPGSQYEQWRLPKNTPDVPSPLVYDGLVYLCRETGVLTCLDAKTGQAHYTGQRLHPNRYRASPVYADGKVYFTARDGVVSVVRAGPAFKLLSENRLPDQFSASPVIANGRIYLRGFENLYAIGPAGK
jgi:outer membrane protein assembly factor BamB